MKVGHFKRLSLGAGAIAAALVGALSGVTHVAAGSNGQLLSATLDQDRGPRSRH
jgi:hypothetical protein